MPDTVTQPTAAPTAKVSAAGVGGTAAVVVLWIADAAGLHDLPLPVAGAIATLAAFGAAYLKKELRRHGVLPGDNGVPDHAA